MLVLLHRFFYERDDGGLVALDIEVFQFEVSVNRVAAVPSVCVVVGVHRDTSPGEFQVSVR